MRICYIFPIITLIVNFAFINAVTDFSKDEMVTCMSIVPKTPQDCLNMSSTFTTLICCHYSMSYPLEGNICVAMSPSAKGMKKNEVNVTLPVDMTFTGSYTCQGEILSLSNIFTILIITYCLFS